MTGGDGSHLRITAQGGQTGQIGGVISGDVPSYTVEFPDGTVHTFAHRYSRPRPVSGVSHDFTDVVWDVGSSEGTNASSIVR